MAKSKIFTSLDNMLENPKSKNFLNHLIRGYFPITNTKKVFSKPEGDFKCVLTNKKLISVDEVRAEIQSEEFKQTFLENIKVELNGETIKTNPYKNILGDKQLGFTGNDTTTFMSLDALVEFYDWVLTESLKGNKHINWLLKSINYSAKTNKEFIAKDKPKKIKPTTFSLGEASDVLGKLKQQMENV